MLLIYFSEKGHLCLMFVLSLKMSAYFKTKKININFVDVLHIFKTAFILFEIILFYLNIFEYL